MSACLLATRGAALGRRAAPRAVHQRRPPAARAELASSSPAAASRKAAAAALAGLLLATSHVALAARAVDMEMASPAAVEGMRRRDEAMRFQCKAMMDCEGDRREFAAAQVAAFAERQRSGDAAGEAPCKVEEPCSKDVLGAAFNASAGLLSDEKLIALGKNPDDFVNSTGYVYGGGE